MIEEPEDIYLRYLLAYAYTINLKSQVGLKVQQRYSAGRNLESQ